MEETLLILRLILAGVFVTSATAKLLDFEGAKKAMNEFGMPLPASGSATAVLISFEYVVSFLFLPVETSKFAAIFSAGLLLVFTVAMLRLMFLGKSTDCRCFGQLESRPVDTGSIVRNSVLITLALLVFGIAEHGLDIIGISSGGSSNLFLAILGFLAWSLITASVILGLESRNLFGEIKDRLGKVEATAAFLEKHEAAGDPLKGMPVGAAAQDVMLEDVDGNPTSLSGFWSDGKPALVILAGPTCVPCEALAQKFAGWGAELSQKIELAVITSGEVDLNVEKFGVENKGRLFFQNADEAALALGSKWTPTAVLVGPNGRIASRPAAGDNAIEELVEYIRNTEFESDLPLFVGAPDENPANGFGKEIADFKLETIAGSSFTKKDMQGQFTLAVFWSLTCSHCIEMLDQLKSWRSNGNGNGLALAIFADGDEKKLLETGLEESLIFDAGYKVSEKMGMRGTPSAVIIDDSGRIISELVAGAERIRLLAGYE